MHMLKLPALALCAVLCGCAAPLTHERCEQAAAGLQTVEQIAAVLVNRGVEPEKARKLADAVLTGQLLLAVACAQASPSPT